MQIFFIWERLWLWSPGWPQTHRGLPVSVFSVLGLEAHTLGVCYAQPSVVYPGVYCTLSRAQDSKEQYHVYCTHLTYVSALKTPQIKFFVMGTRSFKCLKYFRAKLSPRNSVGTWKGSWVHTSRERLKETSRRFFWLRSAVSGQDCLLTHRIAELPLPRWFGWETKQQLRLEALWALSKTLKHAA